MAPRDKHFPCRSWPRLPERNGNSSMRLSVIRLASTGPGPTVRVCRTSSWKPGRAFKLSLVSSGFYHSIAALLELTARAAAVRVTKGEARVYNAEPESLRIDQIFRARGPAERVLVNQTKLFQLDEI